MPQRLLRPGIRQSKRWNRVGYFEQTLYVRLMTLVDDYGRYEADPELIRSETFPFGDPDGNTIPIPTIDSGLLTLASKEMLFLYENGDKRYLQLTRWKERARSESKWPTPESSKMLTNDISCQQMIASTPSPQPSPSPARAPSEPAHFPEAATPSWEEFWQHLQAIAMHGERYARDKFLAAEQKNWQNCSNWKAYAGRVKGWWESDGRPMEKIEAKTPVKPPGPRKFMKKWGIDNPPTRQECVDDGQFDSFHQMWRLMFAEDLKKRAANGAPK